MITLSKIAAKVMQYHNPHIVIGNFRKNVVLTLKNNFKFDKKELYDSEDIEHISDYCKGFVPDAYRICLFCQTITIYEIEDTSELTVEKLQKIADLWFLLDDYYWTLQLVVVDRYGLNERYLDLCAIYFALIKCIDEEEKRKIA